MGRQLDKRMLHWQPAKCCIFQLFIIIICYLANKVLLLLLLLLCHTLTRLTLKSNRLLIGSCATLPPNFAKIG